MTISSMTGYARHQSRGESPSFEIEIRSVNHRYAEYSLKLPESFLAAEDSLKELLRKNIGRGKVHIVYRAIGNVESAGKIRLNKPRLELYLKELKRASGLVKISNEWKASDIILQSDLWIRDTTEVCSPALQKRLEKSLIEALGLWEKMKQREGRRLESDIRSRVRTIARSLKDIEKKVEAERLRLAAGMRERFLKEIDKEGISSEQLIRETLLMTERIDVTEEIVRLESHLALINETLAEKDLVGKKLDFISQELNREVNTIASKSSSAEIKKLTIWMKDEIERIREQVQNIE